MVSPGRKRILPKSQRLARPKPGTREPAHRIFVFCEGKTEKVYLEWLAQRFRRPAVQVEIKGKRGVPMTVVNEACAKAKTLAKDARSPIEERFAVWAVCDRDEHPNFDDAAETAARGGVGFAWSTPCVELWALLHLVDHQAHLHHHECQRALHAETPKYHHDNHPCFDCDALTEERRAVATTRALNLHRRAVDAGNPFENPTTALWKLVQVLEHGSAGAARAHAKATDHPATKWWSDMDPGAAPAAAHRTRDSGAPAV